MYIMVNKNRIYIYIYVGNIHKLKIYNTPDTAIRLCAYINHVCMAPTLLPIVYHTTGDENLTASVRIKTLVLLVTICF